MVAKSGGVPRDAPASFSTSIGNDHHYRRGLWRRGGGHGGPSKPFGNLLWERAQFVMEKVLEKKGVNKWRCFLHWPTTLRPLFPLKTNKNFKGNHHFLRNRLKVCVKDPNVVSRPTLSFLCYAKRRRKLSLWWVCPFFIRALNISIFGGGREVHEVHVFMFHKKKKKKNNNNKSVLYVLHVMSSNVKCYDT